jgi:hypothetical protein
VEKNAALPRQLCKTRPDLLLTFQTPIQTPSSKRDSRVGREERATFGDAEPILQPFFFRFFIFIYFFFPLEDRGETVSQLLLAVDQLENVT